MTPDPNQVRKRKVFYIPGYDPFPPRRYRELYRKEGERQADVSGYELRVDGTAREGGYGWSVSGLFGKQRVHADVEVLIWSDIVQSSMSNSILGTYWQLLRTSWTYIASGTLRRLAVLPKGPLIAALYPIGVLLLQLLLAVLLAHLVGWSLSGVFNQILPASFKDGAMSRWGQALLYWTPFFAIVVVVLRWFKAMDHKLYAYYLMHDFAFSASKKGATPAPLQDRLTEFRATIEAALLQDYDEVLIVGHSSGAHLAVSILADILNTHPDMPKRPAVSLLTLGHVIPMVSFLPKAYQLRSDLQVLSESDDIVWVDVSAPGDGCSFALCDPVSTSGVATEHKQWPLVFSAQLSRSMGEEQWNKLRRKFFRLHFQYLCAFETPLDYDYFQITAGPATLGARYSLRAPPKSRIDVPVSKYTSIAP